MVSRLDHAGISLGIDDQTRLVACLSRHMNKRSQNQKVYNNSKNDKNDVFSMKGKQKGSINNFNNDSSSKTCDDNVTINLEQFCVALGVEMITDHKGNIDDCQVNTAQYRIKNEYQTTDEPNAKNNQTVQLGIHLINFNYYATKVTLVVALFINVEFTISYFGIETSTEIKRIAPGDI
jgi:hypothetical protein